jgi:TRAP-type C4-dicarboxylate transport system substrate-binding protein
MQRKDTVAQRPLFTEWPTWQQLPTEVRQRVEQLLVSMCLEVIQSNNDQEQSDE